MFLAGLGLFGFAFYQIWNELEQQGGDFYQFQSYIVFALTFMAVGGFLMFIIDRVRD